jgi:diguanylate cyclase (GGDEF)-like protein
VSAQQRRLEDREISILVIEPGVQPGTAADPAVQGEPLVVRYAIDPDDETVTAHRPHQVGWKLDASAFLLDLPGQEDAILVVGPELRKVARGAGGSDLLRRAAHGAASWRRERARALRRLKLPDRLLAFSEELNRAHTLEAVCSVLMEHVGRIVGGYTGVVYLYENAGDGEDMLTPVEHPWLTLRMTDTTLSSELRFLGPGLITADAVLAGVGSQFGNLASVFRESGAAAMAYVPLGDRGMLLLVERRGHRIFEAEDWDLLRSVARQAEVALERVSLFHRVHTLSLTDPLTGLGNRRKLEIVLEHAFAGARRGNALCLVMIDMDGFKEFNDTHGHVRGDAMLIEFARCLQDQVRGSDLVVRYGGDEFLFVLPGADADAAAATVERIRASLKPTLNFTAGIAQYEPGIASPNQLVDVADKALYEQRRRDRSTTVFAD